MLLQNHFLKLLLSWVLGYMRWTQLTPMVLMWGFGLFMLLALTLVNFQEQTVSAVQFVLEWLAQLPVVGEYIRQFLGGENTKMPIGSSNFESFVLSGWAVLSLVFMLIGTVFSALFGPFKPWALKSKLLLAGFGAALLLTGLLANYYAVPQNFNGEASAWMLNFSLISLLVFVVSGYCLSVSHFLGYLNEVIMAGEGQAAGDSGRTQ